MATAASSTLPEKPNEKSDIETDKTYNSSQYDLSDEVSALEEELQLLEAIYIHELTITRSETSGFPDIVSVLLHPATADDPDKQYVCLTLVLTLNQQYPNELPGIEIKNPRGLADEEIIGLHRRLYEHAVNSRGNPMLYELIEISKELLTDSNIPHCPCVVCLEHFHSDSEFTKTPCYHYLHKHCLQRYVTFCLLNTDDDDDENHLQILPHKQQEKTKQVLCPTCRQPITSCVEEILDNPTSSEPAADDLIYQPSNDIVAMQKKMAELYAKQKSRGGIIDVEEESNKFLVQDGDTVSIAVPLPDVDIPENPDHSKTRSKSSEQYRRNDYHGNRRKNDYYSNREKCYSRNDRGFRRKETPSDRQENRQGQSRDCETPSGNKENRCSYKLARDSETHRQSRDGETPIGNQRNQYSDKQTRNRYSDKQARDCETPSGSHEKRNRQSRDSETPFDNQKNRCSNKQARDCETPSGNERKRCSDRQAHDCETPSGSHENRHRNNRTTQYGRGRRERQFKNNDRGTETPGGSEVKRDWQTNSVNKITFVATAENKRTETGTASEENQKIQQAVDNHERSLRGRAPGRRASTRGRCYTTYRNYDRNEVNDSVDKRPSSHHRGRGFSRGAPRVRSHGGRGSRGGRGIDRSTLLNDKADS
ncbi:uncharacterized protein LOC141900475 [Tubulanus polymorphus]|uniref:uncharacterized protein LOC141900475 n=1 Tax=Tubulanus polymorphus TaxID=672921 RepID=UPI003DA3FE80